MKMKRPRVRAAADTPKPNRWIVARLSTSAARCSRFPLTSRPRKRKHEILVREAEMEGERRSYGWRGLSTGIRDGRKTGR